MRLLAHMLVGVALLLVRVDAAGVPPEAEATEAGANGHSEEDEREAKEEFDTIDTNKDGFITREEILEMEEVPEPEEIDEFFSTYDSNTDGRITFEEILTADSELRAAAEPDGAQQEL